MANSKKKNNGKVYKNQTVKNNYKEIITNIFQFI